MFVIAASVGYSPNCVGEFVYPSGCIQGNRDYSRCDYVARWRYREEQDDIIFHIEMRMENLNDWTGIGISSDGRMVRSIMYSP